MNPPLAGRLKARNLVASSAPVSRERTRALRACQAGRRWRQIMSKQTIPVDGEAMAAEGQQSKPTTERDRSSALLEIADELVDVRNLIEAAHMAAGTLSPEESNPMQALLDFVSQMLRAASDKLETARQQPEEAVNG